MKGVNKAIILGHVGKDPEVRYMPSGGAAANFSVATSEQWKDKQTGEKKEKTEWHNISAFGKLAEIIGEYVKKGTPVYIEGRIQTRKWQDREGNDRYTTEIVANELQMLGQRNSTQSDDSSQSGNDSSKPEPAGFDGDDIPFNRLTHEYYY